MLRENSAAIEAAGQLTDPVVDALHDKGTDPRFGRVDVVLDRIVP